MNLKNKVVRFYADGYYAGRVIKIVTTKAGVIKSLTVKLPSYSHGKLSYNGTSKRLFPRNFPDHNTGIIFRRRIIPLPSTIAELGSCV